MAFLGGQMVITIIALSFFHKLAVRFSFARYILSDRLIRYLLPSNDELKKEAGLINSQTKGKLKKDEKDLLKKQDFKISKKLDFPLYAETIKSNHLFNLPFYPEYQWLTDFALFSLFVYAASELYFYFNPKSQEINLSLIWCCMVLVFVMKTLFSLTRLYFRGGDEAIGERSMCIIIGGFYFLISMVFLIVREEFLEFGLKEGYDNFYSKAAQLLKARGIEYALSAPISELMFKFWLASWSGLIAIFFTFPGLRCSQMHKDALLNNVGKPFKIIFLNLSFYFPIIVLLLWIKPMSRNLLTASSFLSEQPLVRDETFEILRILSVILLVFTRIYLMPVYLQSYLNLALIKVTNIKKQSGKIRNIDLQKIITSIYYYLCVVALQYLTPLLNLLFLILLFKTLSNHSWITSSVAPTNDQVTDELKWKNLALVFNSAFFHGLIGYITWWSMFVMCTTSLLGLVYHSYFVTD